MRFIFSLLLFVSLMQTAYADPMEEKLKKQSGELIGSYATTIVDNEDGRVHNMQLACQKLNKLLLPPNHFLSFNELIGNSNDPNQGWQVAKVITNHKFEEGYGGGICQVSTTIYNAARAAGLTIIERHHHSMNVSYIQDGLDATVSYPSLDLKLMNNYPYPIRIESFLKGNQVVVYVYLLK
jgi:vancomycin resistance protein YoaR